MNTNGKLKMRLTTVGGAIAMLSLLARGWGITRVGLTHSDEGVYLLSSFWSLHSDEPFKLFPWQKLFSPPAYFGLIGAVNWLFGKASDLHGIAINVAFGWLTVVAAYWAGKRWFGAGAGMAAAVLIGFSQFHIAFSRSALTDTGFTFCLLISLVLIAIQLEKNEPIWGIPAGLAVGAAWNMKYHGWLLLVLAFAAAAIKGITARSDPARIRKLAFGWIVTAGVAVATFLPWMLYTQFQLEGYLEVHQFQSQFFSFHWVRNFRAQAEMQRYFDGWLSRISPSLALLSAWLCSAGSSLNWVSLITVALLLLIASTLVGTTLTCLALAIVAVAQLGRTGPDFARLLLLTFGIFFVLIPWYEPYARLALPFSVTVMLLAGYVLNRFLASQTAQRAQTFLGQGKWRQILIPSAAALLAGVVIHEAHYPGPHTWVRETDYRDAVEQMASVVPQNGVVFILAEPEAAFYFQSAGRQTFCICIDLETYRRFESSHPFRFDRNAPQFVVAGFYATQAWHWNPAGGRRRSSYTLLAQLPAPPSDIRLLDDFPDEQSRKSLASEEQKYDLYLYKYLGAGGVSSSASSN